jgi:hypothetical protein
LLWSRFRNVIIPQIEHALIGVDICAPILRRLDLQLRQAGVRQGLGAVHARRSNAAKKQERPKRYRNKHRQSNSNPRIGEEGYFHEQSRKTETTLSGGITASKMAIRKSKRGHFSRGNPRQRKGDCNRPTSIVESGLRRVRARIRQSRPVFDEHWEFSKTRDS